jgi:hypothetical protein
MVPLLHALRRHTVPAAERAEVRDGQPKISDFPAAAVKHRAGLLSIGLGLLYRKKSGKDVVAAT